MDGYEVESAPFYISPDGLILLFGGVSKERQGLPVVIRQHLFPLQFDSTNLSIYQSLNAVLTQAKTQHPFYRDALDVLFDFSDSQCIISYVLDGRDLDPTRRSAYTEVEIQTFLPPTVDSNKSVQTGDIARDYNLAEIPFHNNIGTNVSLYMGRNKTSDIVVKAHEFNLVTEADANKRIAQALSTALVQARVQHSHTCDILEVNLRFVKAGANGRLCCVYHVLEVLESDIYKDIQQRKTSKSPYSEAELRDFLIQTSEALVYVHSKGRRRGVSSA